MPPAINKKRSGQRAGAGVRRGEWAGVESVDGQGRYGSDSGFGQEDPVDQRRVCARGISHLKFVGFASKFVRYLPCAPPLSVCVTLCTTFCLWRHAWRRRLSLSFALARSRSRSLSPSISLSLSLSPSPSLFLALYLRHLQLRKRDGRRGRLFPSPRYLSDAVRASLCSRHLQFLLKSLQISHTWYGPVCDLETPRCFRTRGHR